jgi:hypothetical protein
MALASAVFFPNEGPPAEEKSLRYRVETLDAMLGRAQAARKAKRISLEAYRSMVLLLREEEDAVETLARGRRFEDLEEGTYWQRGRLKFPSLLRQETVAVSEGRDPATEQR